MIQGLPRGLQALLPKHHGGTQARRNQGDAITTGSKSLRCRSNLGERACWVRRQLTHAALSSPFDEAPQPIENRRKESVGREYFSSATGPRERIAMFRTKGPSGGHTGALDGDRPQSMSTLGSESWKVFPLGVGMTRTSAPQSRAAMRAQYRPIPRL